MSPRHCLRRGCLNGGGGAPYPPVPPASCLHSPPSLQQLQQQRERKRTGWRFPAVEMGVWNWKVTGDAGMEVPHPSISHTSCLHSAPSLQQQECKRNEWLEVSCCRGGGWNWEMSPLILPLKIRVFCSLDTHVAPSSPLHLIQQQASGWCLCTMCCHCPGQSTSQLCLWYKTKHL